MVTFYLRSLQKNIVDRVEEIDGTPFIRDKWTRPDAGFLQGGGLTCIIENGPVFERAGCGFSLVRGTELSPSASQHRREYAGLPFEATGVSLVFHPRNPYAPTVHFNIRMISVQISSTKFASWFGGGMDLTPYYGFLEDTIHFHTVCRRSVAEFGDDKYPTFKKWTDEYFFLKHRNEARGIGGIFFDDFIEGGFENGFALIQSVGDEFLNAYLPILLRRKDMEYGESQREFQRHRRSRYVEFNLIYDRGTHFGLQSGGRTESILLSMPPTASWAYQYEPKEGSPEAELFTEFLPVRDWV
jgi:coproporphyrinogen III oxidase